MQRLTVLPLIVAPIFLTPASGEVGGKKKNRSPVLAPAALRQIVRDELRTMNSNDQSPPPGTTVLTVFVDKKSPGPVTKQFVNPTTGKPFSITSALVGVQRGASGPRLAGESGTQFVIAPLDPWTNAGKGSNRSASSAGAGTPPPQNGATRSFKGGQYRASHHGGAVANNSGPAFSTAATASGAGAATASRCDGKANGGGGAGPGGATAGTTGKAGKLVCIRIQTRPRFTGTLLPGFQLAIASQEFDDFAASPGSGSKQILIEPTGPVTVPGIIAGINATAKAQQSSIVARRVFDPTAGTVH